MEEFWKNNRDTIIVGLIMLLAGGLLTEPIKALIRKIGNSIGKLFESLGFGFQKRYYHGLIEEHKWWFVGSLTTQEE